MTADSDRPCRRYSGLLISVAGRASVRKGLFLAAVVGLVTSGTAFAQPRVVYVDGPSYQWGNYQVSFSRKHGPTNFEMAATVSTLSQAQAEVRRLQGFDAGMWPSTTTWRLAVIEVSVKRGLPKGSNSGGSGPSTSERIARLREQLTKLRREILTMRLTPSLAARSPESINRLIDQYNDLLNQGRRDLGQAAVSGFSPEARIQVRQWFFDVAIAGRGNFLVGPFKSVEEANQRWVALQRQYGRNIRRIRGPYTR